MISWRKSDLVECLEELARAARRHLADPGDPAWRDRLSTAAADAFALLHDAPRPKRMITVAELLAGDPVVTVGTDTDEAAIPYYNRPTNLTHEGQSEAPSCFDEELTVKKGLTIDDLIAAYQQSIRANPSNKKTPGERPKPPMAARDPQIPAEVGNLIDQQFEDMQMPAHKEAVSKALGFSPEGQAAFAEGILNPPPMAPAMKRAPKRRPEALAKPDSESLRMAADVKAMRWRPVAKAVRVVRDVPVVLYLGGWGPADDWLRSGAEVWLTGCDDLVVRFLVGREPEGVPGPRPAGEFPIKHLASCEDLV